MPEFHPRLKEEFRNIQFAKTVKEQTSLIEAVNWIPVVRLAESFKARLSNHREQTVANRQSVNDPSESRFTVNTFRQNRAISRRIAEFYSVKPMFVLQPHAAQNYNTALYRKQPLATEFFELRASSQESYAAMRQDADLIYLGDLFEEWGNNNKAIVDEAHYNPPFHQLLAKKIADKTDINGLNPKLLPLDKAAATGSRTES